MDNYSVMMSAAAAEDIGGIADYIANTLLEPETAAKLIGRLKTAVKSLETMPEGIRSWLIHTWRFAAYGHCSWIITAFFMP